jgi:predicted HicB family RNase H-like nuclease
MMHDKLKYKEYTASIVGFNEKDNVLYGRVDNINDVIGFQGKDIAALKEQMAQAIEGYIDFCKECGDQPERPYGGVISFRCGAELHKAIALQASKRNLSINTFLIQAVQRALRSPAVSGQIDLKQEAGAHSYQLPENLARKSEMILFSAQGETTLKQ